MHILLVIIQFPPDVNSTGRLMAQLCEEWVARGHRITVLTSFPHYDRFQVWEEYRGKVYERAIYRGMDVRRLWVYASGNKQNMWHRLASYLSFNLMASLAGTLSFHRYDVILCTNGSFFTGLTGAVIGAPRRTPVVYNVQDLYPEVPVRAGQITNPRMIRALEFVERLMYRLATHITVIAPSFKEHLVTAKGVSAPKVSVIPNFVDVDFIRPLPKDNPFSRKYGLEDKFVVTHAGNIGFAYDLETMLRAAHILRAEKDIRFLIVGDGVVKQRLVQIAQALNLDNVLFLPFQPHEDLPYLRAASDVQVNLYARGSALYSMPSKVYEIMASGRALLASAEEGSDVWRLVRETGCGICVEPENVEAFVDALMRLYKNPDERTQMAANGRYYAEHLFSRRAVATQYETLLNEVAGA